jgi:hypothetical protein
MLKSNPHSAKFQQTMVANVERQRSKRLPSGPPLSKDNKQRKRQPFRSPIIQDGLRPLDKPLLWLLGAHHVLVDAAAAIPALASCATPAFPPRFLLPRGRPLGRFTGVPSAPLSPAAAAAGARFAPALDAALTSPFSRRSLRYLSYTRIGMEGVH